MKISGEGWAGLILLAIGIYLLDKAHQAKAANSDPTAATPSIFAGTGVPIGQNVGAAPVY